MKKLIFNADDYGLCESFNRGIEQAYKHGFLTSTSVRTNGRAYKTSIKSLRKHCPDIGVGVHLNIVEGKTNLEQEKRNYRIYTKDGHFTLSYIKIIINSFKSDFLKQIELEFRDQIETALSDLGSLDHINSHQHCNSVPQVFDLTCQLAQEYGIKYVRVPREKLVFSDQTEKLFTTRFIINIFKFMILNFFSVFNFFIAKKYNVKTNDYFSGVLYTGFMDGSIIRKAIQKIKSHQVLEILLHPCCITGSKSEEFLESVRNYVIDHNRRKELEVIQDQKLLTDILNDQVILTQYNLISTSNASLNRSQRINTFKNYLDNKEEPLSLFLVIDETTFFHPELVHYLLNDIDNIRCVGACRVVLPNGGALQNYLLKNWNNLGFKGLFLLSMTTVAMRIFALLPKFIRGDFEAKVSSVFKKHHVPFIDISSIDNKTIEYIRSSNPDIIYSSNSLIFPEDLLDVPKIAVLNRHSSLLPSYGGILPVFRAIQFQEKYTGVSINIMEKKIDGGPVLSRKWLPIEQGDSLFRLYRLLFTLSFFATEEALLQIRKKGLNANHIKNGAKLKKSYYSFPEKDDWIKFKQQGGRFI